MRDVRLGGEVVRVAVRAHLARQVAPEVVLPPEAVRAGEVVDELVRVKGIGPKTARFFVMHSRRDQKVATLDVHILKWLREQGVERVPSQTPQNEVAYKRLEEKFLKLAKGLGKDPAELDLEIWKKKAKKDLTSCRA